ncbi:hypothetical protein QR680_010029 [Steinernema hermaphroditum]|uniref:Uncharacterized protein n=1 Tax=Steinernema hermaphroditum TaxID=289476 RepID=A0AA39INU1_9BILA|nr:hypothetical protein QR680_010029 [Steinernema hermaphroditum]
MSSDAVASKTRSAVKSAKNILRKVKRELSFDNINPDMLTGMMMIHYWPVMPVLSAQATQSTQQFSSCSNCSEGTKPVTEDKKWLLE